MLVIGDEAAATAAVVFAVATGGVIVFQIALAAGAPWGAYAMGGAFPGKFPPGLRAAALVQAAVLGLFVMVVLSRSGLAFSQWMGVSAGLVWVVVAFSALAVVLNAVTPSRGERRIWAPVAVVMLACSVVVALG
jgi:hypothetical protein